MAKLALGVAGGLIAGPIGMQAGFLLGSLLFPEKKHIEGPRLGDLSVTGSTYGSPIPDVYGGIRIAGQIIASSGIREVVTNTGGGGKGGPKVERTTYTYFVTLALLLCRGPVLGYRRVWTDSELLVGSAETGSADPMDRIDAAVNQSFAGGGFEFYFGDEDQLPDPSLEAIFGAGNVPAYRGWSYMVLTDMPLARYGNRIPNFTVEVLQGTAVTPVAEEVLRIAPGFGRANDGNWIGAERDRVQWFGLNRPNSLLIAGWTITQAKGTGGPEGGGADPEQATQPHELADVGPANDPRHLQGERPDADIGEVYKIQGDTDDKTLIAYKRARGGPNASPFGGSNEIYFHKLDGPRVHIESPGDYSTWQSNGRYVSRNGRVVAYRVNANPVAFMFSRFDPFNGWSVPDLFNHPAGALGMTSFEQRVAMHPNGTWLYFFHRHATDTTKVVIDRCALPFNGTWEVDWREIPAGTLIDPDLMTTTSEGIWISDRVSSEFVLLSFEARVVRRYTNPDVADPFLSIRKDYLWVQGRLIITAIDQTVVYFVPDDVGGALDAGVPLADVVSDICQRVNVPHDVSLLTGTVLGHVRARPMTARAAIESLQRSHLFDAVESGDVIRFVPRGRPPVATIPVDNLLDDTPFALTRAADLELPRRVTVRYIAHGAEYQDGAQQSQRIITGAQSEVVVDLPTVMKDDDAARSAEVLLFDAWQSRESGELGYPGDYALLEPTDVIDIDVPSGQYRLRIIDQDYDPPHRITVRTAVEDSAVYVSQAAGGTVQVRPATLPFTGTTNLMIIDMPLFVDEHLEPAVYGAAWADGDGWRGAEIYRSLDTVTFDPVATTVQQATVGDLLSPLGPPATTDVTDLGNTIDVRVNSTGGFESVTEDEFLANANAVIVGSEIITFRDATLTAPGRYTLSHLSRGRRGTELWMDHRAGERVILINTALVSLPVPKAALRSDVSYRAVTLGTLPDAADTIVERYEGWRCRPYAPTQLEASDNGDGTFTATWTRRTRIGGAWVDGAGVPLSEESEAYTVKVYAGGFGTTLLSQTTVTTPTATVTAVIGNRITVAQVSAVYGDGETVDLTL